MQTFVGVFSNELIQQRAFTRTDNRASDLSFDINVNKVNNQNLTALDTFLKHNYFHSFFTVFFVDSSS